MVFVTAHWPSFCKKISKYPFYIINKKLKSHCTPRSHSLTVHHPKYPYHQYRVFVVDNKALP